MDFSDKMLLIDHDIAEANELKDGKKIQELADERELLLRELQETINVSGTVRNN